METGCNALSAPPGSLGGAAAPGGAGRAGRAGRGGGLPRKYV